MSPFTLLLVAVAVSADAFAVAVGKGLGMRRLDLRAAGSIAVAFGGFQALMPLVGWLLGSRMEHLVAELDHWIAFGLLAGVGTKMLWEAYRDAEDEPDGTIGWGELVVLSTATSIDALAVGITFAFLPVSILPAVVLIGVTTTTIALVGVLVGHHAGSRWRRPAEFAGGVVLVMIGLRVLLDHTGVI
ncbi:MAG: manganese efflux pump MntP family protein [Actinomycetota bacterium]|nr:manganese efflux pump MntP family protein [Actinomycetota bacterium]